MIIEPRSRFFQLYELVLRTPRNKGVPLAMHTSDDRLDFLEVVRRSHRKDACTITLKRGDKVTLTALDVREEDNVAVFLVRRNDLTASTPFFEHMKERKIRKADRDAEEAVVISAHLFVELTPSPNNPTRYRAILEEIPGLGRSYIQGLLGEIARKHKYAYKGRNGHDEETYSILEMEGFRSEKLGSALKNGVISFVQLVKPAEMKGMDENAFTPRDQKMTIAMKAKGEGALAALRDIQIWAKEHNWNDMRVQIRMPNDRSRLVSIAREEDAAAVLFVASEQVNVGVDLDVCTEKVNDVLVQKALELFSADWSALPKG